MDPSLSSLAATRDILSTNFHLELSGHIHNRTQNFDYLRQRDSNGRFIGPLFVLGYPDEEDRLAVTISEIPTNDCITASMVSDIFGTDGVFQAQGGLWYNLVWGPQVIGARSKEVFAGFKMPLNCAVSVIIVQ